MAKCSNCGKALSCGCQKRKASNGVSACSNCLTNYEATLKQNTKAIPQTQTQQPQQVWGANRYNKTQIK
jgi:hypothetical protein